jgi:hypothetical protein
LDSAGKTARRHGVVRAQRGWEYLKKKKKKKKKKLGHTPQKYPDPPTPPRRPILTSRRPSKKLAERVKEVREAHPKARVEWSCCGPRTRCGWVSQAGLLEEGF